MFDDISKEKLKAKCTVTLDVVNWGYVLASIDKVEREFYQIPRFKEHLDNLRKTKDNIKFQLGLTITDG